MARGKYPQSDQSPSSGFCSGEDDLEVINKKDDLPKLIFEIERLRCTTDGVCSECKFSRKVEADNQSEKSKYTKQQVPCETQTAIDKKREGDCSIV